MRKEGKAKMHEARRTRAQHEAKINVRRISTTLVRTVGRNGQVGSDRTGRVGAIGRVGRVRR